MESGKHNSHLVWGPSGSRRVRLVAQRHPRFYVLRCPGVWVLTRLGRIAFLGEDCPTPHWESGLRRLSKGALWTDRRDRSTARRCSPERGEAMHEVSKRVLFRALLEGGMSNAALSRQTGEDGWGASEGEPDHRLHQPGGAEPEDPADGAGRGAAGVGAAELPGSATARKLIQQTIFGRACAE